MGATHKSNILLSITHAMRNVLPFTLLLVILVFMNACQNQAASPYSDVEIKVGLQGTDADIDCDTQNALCDLILSAKLTGIDESQVNDGEVMYGGEFYCIYFAHNDVSYSWAVSEQSVSCIVTQSDGTQYTQYYQKDKALLEQISNLIS